MRISLKVHFEGSGYRQTIPITLEMENLRFVKIKGIWYFCRLCISVIYIYLVSRLISAWVMSVPKFNTSLELGSS